MEMGCPAAVFFGCADAREFFSASDPLPYFQVREGFCVEVARQSKECASVTSVVLQNYQRTVIERCGVVRQRVNYTVERRMDRSARLSEQIHPQMNGSTLFQRTCIRAEQRRGVQQTRFVVASYADGHLCFIHQRGNFPGQYRSFGFVR